MERAYFKKWECIIWVVLENITKSCYAPSVVASLRQKPVPEQRVYGKPLVGPFLQGLHDEQLGAHGQIHRNRKLALSSQHIYAHYALHGFLPAYVVEGSPADQHLVGQHPDRPDIHEVIVGFALQDLRADVVQGAAVGGPPLFAVDSPPEVA